MLMTWIKLYLLALVTLSFSVEALGQWYRPDPSNIDSIFSLASQGEWLFAGTTKSIRISSNEGSTWADKGEGLPDQHVLSIESIISTTGLRLFGCLNAKSLYSSQDTGRSWSALPTPTSRPNLVERVSMPGGNNLLFTSTNSEVYASRDSGITWQLSNEGMDNAIALSFTGIEDLVFAAGVKNYPNGAIFVSTDEGLTWSQSFATSEPILKIVTMDLENGDALFAFSRGEGVWRSTDKGLNWDTANVGLPEGEVQALTVTGNLLFTVVKSSGVYVSKDQGASWEFAGQGLTDTEGFVLESNDSYVYFGGQGTGVWRRPLSDFEEMKVRSITQQVLQLRIYPNPAQMTTQIDLPSEFSGNTTLSVYSTAGVLMHEVLLPPADAAKRLSLDTSDWECGAYIIIVRSGELEASGVLIKR
jgi:photosystem II stability/assembly factor-like uncharacterized protein